MTWTQRVSKLRHQTRHGTHSSQLLRDPVELKGTFDVQLVVDDCPSKIANQRVNSDPFSILCTVHFFRRINLKLQVQREYSAVQYRKTYNSIDPGRLYYVQRIIIKKSVHNNNQLVLFCGSLRNTAAICTWGWWGGSVNAVYYQSPEITSSLVFDIRRSLITGSPIRE